MSLPPGFLDELRTRLSISDVVGRKVMWDTRKSNPGKGDMWAPCPFHQEKSASFHVDDRKGFYYCFGCHAKGDAISFVRETENVGFMEAVEILAGEAGLTMPARDRRAQEKADARTELADVMEQAVQHLKLNLRTAAAAEARAYLARRGLDEAACAHWDIGFAPDHGGTLKALTDKGVPQAKVIEAGLAAESDRGGAPYDRFRGRIIFPIRNARGRAIALGGRAMDPNARAKYLNSPETPLFDKSRTLYNIGPARTAAGKGQTLVVAEGYMDVIALSQAGFEAAVAPLGTAVTEHHLALLWRISDEPVIALDGDTAGLRAAMRTMDVALPLLQSGKSLRFALMPAGQDPDDVLKQQGKEAMQGILDAAVPMVQLLWQRETEGKTFDSPERRAALDKALRDRIAPIQDPDLRGHYDQALKDLKWQLFRKRPQPRRQNRPFQKGQRAQDAWHREMAPSASNRSSALATGAARDDHLREAVILATLIATPAAIDPFMPQIEAMDCADSDHAALRAVLLRIEPGADPNPAIAAAGLSPAQERIAAQPLIRLSSGLRKPGDLDFATACLSEAFAKLTTARALPGEIAEAEADLDAGDESLTWRLSQATSAAERARIIKQGAATEMVVADNGAALDSDELRAARALWDRLVIAKPKSDPK
ncbi:DNA primase [Salipiger sp. IMCC34102]|uniref:DNA primase n=1 Tax=Salipiger sp. IMCC34102 TaxID=2510647 RepID=UPI00101B9E2D|nr:DNA primase [Salipiger sp. IMCC34102]RYH02340.1 DNA primase [Salipiger sp. IMCC34102]